MHQSTTNSLGTAVQSEAKHSWHVALRGLGWLCIGVRHEEEMRKGGAEIGAIDVFGGEADEEREAKATGGRMTEHQQRTTKGKDGTTKRFRSEMKDHT